MDKILAEAAETLDFSQPVAVMMLGLLHFIPDADDPYGLIRCYLDAVPSGSYLAISHASSDLKTDTGTAGQRYNSHSATTITFRSQAGSHQASARAWTSSLPVSPRWASGH